jgi:hypothetical protein
MYSMYPWDVATGASDADAPARPALSLGGANGVSPRTPRHHEFTAALQFALDRRDNGGDAARRREGPYDLRGTTPAPPKGKGYDLRGTTPAPPKGRG